MSLRRRWVAVLSVAATVTALAPVGLGNYASAARAAQRDPAVPGIPQRYLDQPISWSVCPFDATIKQLYPDAPTTNCATVKVPMDWHRPDAHPDISIAISYSEASERSRGLLTTNPGGPGAGGRTLSAALAIDKPRLFEDYDLLGFDPRGFGASTPLQCLTTTEELAALPTTPDYRERTRRTHRTERAEARLLAQACAATEFGEFVSSQQTVYDMELLRAVMGGRLLHFIGYSYGTWLGSWYADTYPNRVGRFVLDSNMDWTHTQWENVNFDPWSFQRRRDTQLLPWIARHADQIDGLGTTPRAVLRQYEAVRAKLVRLVKAGTSSVRGDGLDGNVAGAIYSNIRFIRATLDILVHDEYVEEPSASGDIEAEHVERAWTRLDPALQQYDSLAAIKARYGITDGVEDVLILRAEVARARGSLADGRADEVVNLGAVGTTVRCNDTRWRRGPGFYTGMADRMTRRYPFVGYLNGVPMCAHWPFGPQDRDVDLVDAPRMLMLQAELDPATAYEGAFRSHRETRRATRFVAIDDEGQHGQYVGSASACAEAIGDAFVFSGELPGTNQICGTSPLPEDGSVYPVDGPVDGNAVPLRPYGRAAIEQPNPLLQHILDSVAERSTG